MQQASSLLPALCWLLCCMYVCLHYDFANPALFLLLRPASLLHRSVLPTPIPDCRILQALLSQQAWTRRWHPQWRLGWGSRCRRPSAPPSPSSWCQHLREPRSPCSSRSTPRLLLASSSTCRWAWLAGKGQHLGREGLSGWEAEGRCLRQSSLLELDHPRGLLLLPAAPACPPGLQLGAGGIPPSATAVAAGAVNRHK